MVDDARHPGGDDPGDDGSGDGVNPVSGRVESDDERLDRNFQELLQELRVAQTGTQILFAFLLTVSFTPLLRESDALVHRLLALAILASAGATTLLIAPVAFHRVVFQRGLKENLVMVASWFAQGGLFLLLVALLSTCMIALDAVLDRTLAGWLTVGLGIWALLWWYAFPGLVLLRRRSGRHASRGGR